MNDLALEQLLAEDLRDALVSPAEQLEIARTSLTFLATVLASSNSLTGSNLEHAEYHAETALKAVSDLTTRTGL